MESSCPSSDADSLPSAQATKTIFAKKGIGSRIIMFLLFVQKALSGLNISGNNQK
jgi:hypothetical protein